ncbi:MAG: TIGR03862 family flavoprotein [Albidovulum sp.]
MTAPERPRALIIGAGPAGLMAAEVLAGAGVAVVVAEGRPSAGRKFLMAGKSGLNLTKDEDLAAFCGQISAGWLGEIVAKFGPEAVQGWARDLGQEVFTGSSGRVFPKGMKASPLLRAWLGRLGEAGVELRTRWRWRGFAQDGFLFDTPEGEKLVAADVTVLALGGASWARLGSDGAWVPWLAARGVTVAPFRPANMGLGVEWSPKMSEHFGQPLKNVALFTPKTLILGECVISARGLEGSGIYAMSARVRDGADLWLDLAPGRSAMEIAARLGQARAGDSQSNSLRKAAGLDAAKLAILHEWGRPLPKDPATLAALVKALPVRHSGPRPLDEAISSAGGIARESLGDDLQLAHCPGVFAAGEMLDWEAPTGGYLLTTCLATGRWAGEGALRFLTQSHG